MTLLDFVRLTRTHLLSLVFLTLFGGVAAYGLTLRMPEVYLADASGYVRVEGTGSTTGDGIAANSLGGSKADSYLPLVTSRAVAERAIAATGIQASPADVASRVGASVAEGSVILKVTATGPDPEQARVLADAVITATAAEANHIETAGDSSKQPIVTIVPIESALPGGKIAPNPRRNVLVGLVVGLGVAYLLVFVRRQLDTRVRTVDDVEEYAGASVLGVVPQTKELGTVRGRGRVGELGIAAEAFRQIRTNLRFVGVDDPARSIVVTSANAGEGKSTVAATLARVLGASGQQVVIIDADLRRPTLAKVFDVVGTVGLSHVLTGQLPVEEVMHETDQENVRLVTSGRTPPNPSELLGSVRMRELVAHLAEDHVVILDAPPLLPVTDAGVLSGVCDGTLFVFAVGKTHKEQARLAARMMSQVGGRVLGVVLTLAPRRRVGGVVYGYGYSTYASDYSSAKAYATSEASQEDAVVPVAPALPRGERERLAAAEEVPATPVAPVAPRASSPRKATSARKAAAGRGDGS